MAKKTLFFDNNCGYVVAAATENSKLCEFNFERENKTSVIGNIYKGKVENVLPGMRAAFVNCGLERNCYLSVDDVFPDYGKYEGENTVAPPFPELKEGDEILVQIVKAPINKKGARVTCFPSFVGKNLIFMPLTPFVGVSRKIADEELRKNLVFSASRLKDGDEGIIFRTAAPYAKRSQIETELSYLRNLYSRVMQAFKCAKAGDLIYTDLNLTMRVMRDTNILDVEKIIAGTERLEKMLNDLVNLYPSANRPPVILHGGGKDMMEEYGLSGQICDLLSPRAELENGAYLVIEKTEALTVIDVNTGKFTGSDSLEQTVYCTNIAAAREVARQVKLRNIGGIVVVDFIDMNDKPHSDSIVEELERALKRDSAKCEVAGMSKFGLVQFTRKRTGGSPLSLMLSRCRHCKDGKTYSPRYVLFGLRSKLMNLYSEGCRRVKIDMNKDILSELIGWREFYGDIKQRFKDAEIYFEPHVTYPEELIRYRTEAFTTSDKAVKLK